MTPFWILNALVWTALFFYVLPGAWAATTRRGLHRKDPIHLSVASTAILMGGFSYRWLLAPESELLWQSLYVLSSALALYMAMIVRSYGRGEKL